MHKRLSVALALLATPAVAAEPAGSVPPMQPPPARAAAGTKSEVGPCLAFEVRVVRAPAGFCERGGPKLAGDTVLSAAQVYRLLESAQQSRDANVTQLPKVTAEDGQRSQLRITETLDFVTSLDAVRLDGATVFVPRSKTVECGDSLTISGTCADGGRKVRIEGGLTRVRIDGEPELVPVTTLITPVFEGGSKGVPVPFTQFVQVPDVRTEKVEKAATVPAGGTLVLGGWKETETPPAQPAKAKGLTLFKRAKKDKPAEFEVVVLATVTVLPSTTGGQ